MEIEGGQPGDRSGEDQQQRQIPARRPPDDVIRRCDGQRQRSCAEEKRAPHETQFAALRFERAGDQLHRLFFGHFPFFHTAIVSDDSTCS